jgi:hypothetical protein
MKRDQAAMNDPKPFAALTGTLLARKGRAPGHAAPGLA